MTVQLVLPVEDPSQIAGSRRSVTQLARDLGFDAETSGKAELAVTECATNILTHAGHGQIILRALLERERHGLEILALDRGPGIVDVGASLRDGHSTAGSMGAGLGTLARVTTDFQIYSRPDAGTALRMELWPAQTKRPDACFELGAVAAAKTGEEVCGDGWVMQAGADYLTVMVADGLGHGPDAHRASQAALGVLAKRTDLEPAALIETCHQALASTRGAALGITRLQWTEERGSFAGVGNIACRVEDDHARRQIASHNGTVGHVVRKIQEFVFPFRKNALIILASDGLDTRWNMSDYPGLAARHPGLIAGVLYRDHNRGRDDATVVVVRNKA